MKNLILDCSLGMNVFVVNDEKVYSKIDGTQNKHSDEILVVVDELLKKADLTISQIENICVCVGPGSFTGVRVAVSLAKGLAIGSGARVFTLTNFDIFDIAKTENSVLVLDGFSNFVYVRKNSFGEIKDDCMDVEELSNLIKADNVMAYVTTEKTQNLLKKYEIQSKFAQNCIISAFNEKIMNNETTKLNQILPVYLRASQAEIERVKKL